MVKKVKVKVGPSDTQLAAAIKDSAQQIWLAGVGAFSKAQNEGNRMFERLAREGSSIQKRTMQLTENKVNEVTSHIGKIAGRVQHQANGTWDKLESVFEERVERALKRLGVPTHKEITELAHRVEKLTASVNKLSGGSARKAAPRKRVARRAAATARSAS